ncbi:MAG: hypothetical protein ACPGTG_06790 [Flavobacteriales bacterium]
MQIIKLSLIGFILLTLGSCSEKETKGACYVCLKPNSTNSILITYCDNGDGTMEVTKGNVTITKSLNDVSFEEFILGTEISGSDCTEQ